MKWDKETRVAVKRGKRVFRKGGFRAVYVYQSNKFYILDESSNQLFLLNFSDRLSDDWVIS